MFLVLWLRILLTFEMAISCHPCESTEMESAISVFNYVHTHCLCMYETDAGIDYFFCLFSFLTKYMAY